MSDQSGERLTATQEPDDEATEQAGLRPGSADTRPDPTTDPAATDEAEEVVPPADPDNPVEPDITTPVLDREPEHWGDEPDETASGSAAGVSTP